MRYTQSQQTQDKIYIQNVYGHLLTVAVMCIRVNNTTKPLMRTCPLLQKDMKVAGLNMFFKIPTLTFCPTSAKRRLQLCRHLFEVEEYSFLNRRPA